MARQEMAVEKQADPTSNDMAEFPAQPPPRLYTRERKSWVLN